MNRLLTLFLTLLCLLACGCTKETARTERRGTLEVTLGLPEGDGATRAAYTDSYTSEKTGSGRVLVFDSAGNLEASKAFGETSSFPVKVSLTLTQGEKTVAAVLNVPSSDMDSFTTLPALRAYRYEMSGDLNSSSAKRFQMVGEASVTVGESAVSTTVSVSRVAARVVVRSISNEYLGGGSLKLNRIFLGNVAGDWCASSPSSVSTWYNAQGRSDRTRSHIIDGSSYVAGLPALTCRSLGASVSYGGSWTGTALPLYCYPNASTKGNAGYTSSFSGEYTTLVVAATLPGSSSECYYVIPLDQTTDTCPVEGNYSYTVDLTIYGIGTSDPNTPASGLAAKATVSVTDWYDGREYAATFTETGIENN